MKAIQRILALVAACFTLFLALPTGNAAQAATRDGELRFNADGGFKIMVISDIQDGPFLNKYTKQLIEFALDAEKPDLVVLGGDNVYGPAVMVGKASARRAIDSFVEPVVARGIPFCVVMGNHDGEHAALSKQEQMEYYMQFPGCLAVVGDAGEGVGNYNIVLRSQDGARDVWNLWFIDSLEYASEAEGGGYAYVSDAQIAWREQRALAFARENGGEVVPALLFQHIPVPEIYDVLTEVSAETDGAVEGHGAWAGHYYVLDEQLRRQGSLGEKPCPPDVNNGQFASWKETGDVVAAFFGHDHTNDFVSNNDGIDLGYTPGVGFFSYGNGYEHGVRIIELRESAPGDYTTCVVYYKDLTDTKIPAHLQYLGAEVFGIVVAALWLLALVVFVIVRFATRKRRRERQNA